MPNIVELIPSEQDDAVFRAWEDGKGPQALSREFALTVTQVEQILDRMLPVFDAQNQLRAYKRELRRLEDLSGEFFTIAKRDKNHESAHLVARLNERICAMRGFSPVNVRMDPLTVEVKQQPSRHDRLREAIMRLQHDPLYGPKDANGSDSAVGSSQPQRLNGGPPPEPSR